MQKAKKLLSLFMTLCIVASGMTGLVFTASAADPVTIATAAEFANIGTTGDYLITADIDLTDASATVYQLTEFSGTITGQKADGSNAVITLNGKGLIGTLKDATIKNITLKGAVTAEGKYGTAAFANNTNGANNENVIKFENCINEATVSTTTMGTGGTANPTAGFIGYACGRNAASVTLINCHNKGAITAAATTGEIAAGGLIGYGDDIVIQNCSNQASVTSGGYWNAGVGGLIGYVYDPIADTADNGASITNSFNSGNISSSNTTKWANVGGLVGANGTRTNATAVLSITNSFNAGTIASGVTEGYAAGILGCHRGSSATITNCYNAGTIEVGAAGNIIGFKLSSNTYDGITNCYVLTDKLVTKGDNAKVISAEQSALVTALTADNTTWEADATMLYKLPTLVSNPYPNAVDPNLPSPGESADDPILITNQAEFEAMKNATEFTYYALANDITLNASYEPFAFFGSLTSVDPASPCTITMNINKSTTDSVGLFSAFADSKKVIISDIILDGSVIGQNNVGALVGTIPGDNSPKPGQLAAGSSVTNIVNKADITGSEYVAGIIGYQYRNNGTLTLSHLTNAAEATITSTGNAAGIVGAMFAPGLSNCANLGTIKGKYASGIVGLTAGSESTIDGCYNAGTIAGTYMSAGIITGKRNTIIKNCYNIGNGAQYGIAGMNASDFGVSVTNCYNLGEVLEAPIASASYTNVSNCYYLSVNGTEVDTLSGTTAKTREALQTTSVGSAFHTDSTYPTLTANPQTAAFPTVYLVSVSGNTYTTPSIVTDYVVGASEVSFTVADGVDAAETTYTADTVKANDVPLTANGEDVYTAALTGDTTIAITEKVLITEPAMANSYGAFTSAEGETINGVSITDPMTIVFAKLTFANPWSPAQYGVLISKTSIDTNAITDISNPGEGIQNCVGTKIGESGSFGICFYGTTAEETTYYVVPYTVFTDGSTQTIKYGTEKTFTVNSTGYTAE